MIELDINTLTDTTAADLYIDNLVDNNIVNVYLKQSKAVSQILPIYATKQQAQQNGLGAGELYFTYKGLLMNVANTNIALNLARAVSYLRRLF